MKIISKELSPKKIESVSGETSAFEGEQHEDMLKQARTFTNVIEEVDF